MGIDCGSQVVLCEYPIRLDTYEGCSHDCRYCFARMKRDISNVKPLHCAEQVRAFRRREQDLHHQLVRLAHPAALGRAFRPVSAGGAGAPLHA